MTLNIIQTLLVCSTYKNNLEKKQQSKLTFTFHNCVPIKLVADIYQTEIFIQLFIQPV